MGNADIDARHQTAQIGSNIFEPQDPVMHIIDPAPPAQFAFQRLFDHARIIFGHIGFYRQPFLRRRFDHAHITAIDQRQMQGTRDRRRR